MYVCINARVYSSIYAQGQKEVSGVCIVLPAQRLIIYQQVKAWICLEVEDADESEIESNGRNLKSPN